MWTHTQQPAITKKAQEQEDDIGATELLMEIVNCIREVTAHYARRKHQAITGDKKALRDGIILATQELDAKPYGDTALEAELEYLREALKNLEITTAKYECRATAVKAQFRAQKLREAEP